MPGAISSHPAQTQLQGRSVQCRGHSPAGAQERGNAPHVPVHTGTQDEHWQGKLSSVHTQSSGNALELAAEHRLGHPIT